MKNAFQGTISGAGYGYVYVMSYPNSDKVKIGHSLNPTTRAADIGGTLAPETPTVEAYFWCAERREAVEREAHRIAADSRHNGEWFALSIGQAMTTIQQAASRVGVLAQLAFDRNLWEQKAAEELAARLAALATMSDDEFTRVFNEHHRAMFEKGYRPNAPKTDYELAVEQEAKARTEKWKANVESRRKAERQQAAEQAESAAEAIAKAQLVREEELRGLRFFAGVALASVFSLWSVFLIAAADPNGLVGFFAAVPSLIFAFANRKQSDHQPDQLGETA